MHEARQAAQGSIREIVENAAPSRHGCGVSQALGCGEARWLVCFRIREKEVARSVVSGTRLRSSADTPLTHTGGSSPMQAPFTLPSDQKNSRESILNRDGGAR